MTEQEIDQQIEDEITEYINRPRSSDYQMRVERRYFNDAHNEIKYLRQGVSDEQRMKGYHDDLKPEFHVFGAKIFRKKRKAQLMEEHGLAKCERQVIIEGQQVLDAIKEQNANITKAFNTFQVQAEGLEAIDKMEIATNLLTDRIATEALILANEAPPTIADRDHKQERKLRMDDIRAMMIITKELKAMAIDIRSNVHRNPQLFKAQALPQQSVDALSQAREALLKIGLKAEEIDSC